MILRKFAPIGFVAFAVPALVAFTLVSSTQAKPLVSQEKVVQPQEEKQQSVIKTEGSAKVPATGASQVKKETKSQASANTQVYYNIPELGLRMKVGVALKNELVYHVEKGSKSVSFSTKTLAAMDKSCSAADRASGSIVLEKESTASEFAYRDTIPWWYAADGPNSKRLGGDEFAVFHGPHAVCASNQANTAVVAEKQSESIRALQEAFETIEVIK